MQVISTDKAPQALGPYSQAIVAGNTVYCSGQIAINPATGELVLENIEAEAEQVMNNIGAVLEAAGCTYANVVKTTIFATDINDFINSLKAQGKKIQLQKIAVMGCIVNGPGEASHADIGLAGGDGKAAIFSKGNVIATLPEQEALEFLKKEILKKTT